MSEGRQASAEFNVKSYRNAYADLRQAFGNDLKSYYCLLYTSRQIMECILTAAAK